MENTEILKAAQESLSEGCKILGLQQDIQVIEIKNNSRWVLAFEQSPNHPHFANHMIILEAWLRGYLNTDVDLICESREDKNRRDIKSGRIGPKMVNARNVEKLDS